MRYPFDETCYGLELANFRHSVGVRRLMNGEHFLIVITESGHQDPVLLCDRETHQPFLQTRTLSIVATILGTLSLLVGAKVLDTTIAARIRAKRSSPKPYPSQA